MKGLNVLYLIGHIGQDPDMRTSRTGVTTLKLSLATPNVRKVNEEWKDVPDWHKLTLFGHEAEYVSRFARKGDTLAVQCAVRPNKWTDKDNVVHYDVNIIVDRVLWLNSKGGPKPGQGEGGPPTGRGVPPSEPLDEGDEIPF